MNKVKRITSKENPRIIELQRILKHQNKSDELFFLVEGFHLVEVAKETNLLVEVFSVDEYEFSQVQLVSESVIQKITTTKTPQGIVGLCKKPQAKPLKTDDGVFFLDTIQDPGNVGTILRTLLAFNYDSVILNDKCASLYNPKTILASQGAIFKINSVVMSNEELIKYTKENNVSLVTTEIDKNATKLGDFNQNLSKYIIVLGSEGQGVSSNIKKAKSQSIYIDIQNIDSLNVAITGAIIAYELKHRK